MKAELKNCFNCIAYKDCYRDNKIDLELARINAESCDKPFKGLGTDMVTMKNSPRNISLKKAIRLFKNGRIVWEDFRVASFVDEEKKD